MHMLAHIAKEVKFPLHQPEQGRFKQFNNLQIRLHLRGKNVQANKKQKVKCKLRKRKATSMWLLLAL